MNKNEKLIGVVLLGALGIYIIQRSVAARAQKKVSELKKQELAPAQPGPEQMGVLYVTTPDKINIPVDSSGVVLGQPPIMLSDKLQYPSRPIVPVLSTDQPGAIISTFM